MQLIGMFPDWLLYSLGGVIAIIAYENIFKKAVGNKGKKVDHHPVAYAAAIFITVAIISSLIFIFFDENPSDYSNITNPEILIILLVDIIFYAVAPYFYYRAFKNLPLSEVTILYSMTGIFALFVGLMLGIQNFFLSHLIGGVLIIASVAVVTFKKGKWNFSRDFVLMLIGTLFFALASITDNMLVSISHFSIVFLETISFGSSGILLLIFDKEVRQNFDRMFKLDIYPSIFLNANLYFLSFYAILRAYKSGGNASQVNLVLSTETILVVIFAALFLKERDNMLKKIIAAVLVCVGVYLLR